MWLPLSPVHHLGCLGGVDDQEFELVGAKIKPISTSRVAPPTNANSVSLKTNAQATKSKRGSDSNVVERPVLESELSLKLEGKAVVNSPRMEVAKLHTTRFKLKIIC